MGEVFILLFFLSFVILIVGLIKPRWILRWGEIQTRKRVLLIFGSVAIVCFVLSNAFLSSVTLEEKTAKSERQAIEEKAKEEKNREQAKTKLTEMGIAFTEKDFIDSAKLPDTKALKLFIAAGMNVNIYDGQGRLAIWEATLYHNEDAVKSLLQAGANINMRVKHSSYQDAILIAAGNGDNSKYDNEDAKIIKLLIKSGANPNSLSDNGNTALDGSIFRSSIPRVKALLENGADPNLCNSSGYTHLIEASRRGNLEIVKMLLEHGADPTVSHKTIETITPLSVSKNSSISALLRQNGAQR